MRKREKNFLHAHFTQKWSKIIFLAKIGRQKAMWTFFRPPLPVDKHEHFTNPPPPYWLHGLCMIPSHIYCANKTDRNATWEQKWITLYYIALIFLKGFKDETRRLIFFCTLTIGKNVVNLVLDWLFWRFWKENFRRSSFHISFRM